MKSRFSGPLVAALCCLGATASRGHEAEIHVGANALGQLKVEVTFPQPHILPASIFPGIVGFATGGLGVHSIITAKPKDDFFPVSEAADFRMVLVAKDPGVEVWNDTGSGFLQVGEVFFIGQAPFDSHPLWNLLVDTPGVARSLTLKFRDLNGIHAESAPFTVSFVAPPKLEVTATGPSAITLTWPAFADDLELEQTTTLGGSGSWAPLKPPYPLKGDFFTLTIPIAPGVNAFFRLRQVEE